MRLIRLDDNLVAPLAAMLATVEDSFRPFDFTPASIRMAVKEGDEHWVIALPRGGVVAYGMLRGWADGWRVPALGVAVAPTHRRRGLGTAMVMFLHYIARERGCSHVMLHVDDENSGAKSLYLALGYRQSGERWLCAL